MKLYKTIVYVDGFNFYFGCLKGTKYKWLDLRALLKQLLPVNCDIVHIKYFVGCVPKSSDQKAREKRRFQRTYLNALKHYNAPELSVYETYINQHPAQMPLAEDTNRFVAVIKRVEKQTDVSLAVEMLNDAWLDQYDCAILVSKDNDFVPALHSIRQHHATKRLGLILPQKQKRSAKRLKRSAKRLTNLADADFSLYSIKNETPARAQLPDPIPNTDIQKPPKWHS